jgi:hypothetical protein
MNTITIILKNNVNNEPIIKLLDSLYKHRSIFSKIEIHLD